MTINYKSKSNNNNNNNNNDDNNNNELNLNIVRLTKAPN